MSYLLAVNKKLCGNRFELKVNDIRFIGHPVNLEDYKENYPKESSRHRITGSSVLIFNIVFALKVWMDILLLNEKNMYTSNLKVLTIPIFIFMQI